MSLPTDLFMWCLAFLPIAVLLVLMIGFQWGATEAAPIGLFITVLTGMFFYKADIVLIASESAKGIWNSVSILLVVWTAILMYRVGVEVKAFLVIRNGMRKLLPNELLLVMAMGWIFESFLQGITGFGVPVAVGAPLLIGIGVKPLWAVIIPLLGQAWGNTFGTLAAAWDALAVSAGIPVGSEHYFLTAFWTALFLLFWNVITGFAICWFYGRKKAIAKGFIAVVITALIQGGGELILSQINTTLANFIPACISMVAILLIGKMKMYRDEWAVHESPIMNRDFSGADEESAPEGMSLIQAFIPYIMLSIITLAVLLIEPLNKFLGSFSFGFSFPETQTAYGVVNKASAKYAALSLFTHASMFLFLSSIWGIFYYQRKGWMKAGGVGRIFMESVAMTVPSGIAVIGLIIMSKIMSGTGQTVVLANGISAVLGKAYVIFAPFVGLLGTFMTGSNMSSNILFGDFQMTTSNMLGVNSAAVLGAQSTGGAIGSAISPSKIILGTTTAQILGSEGVVMKKLLIVTVPTTLIIGFIVYML